MYVDGTRKVSAYRFSVSCVIGALYLTDLITVSETTITMRYTQMA